MSLDPDWMLAYVMDAQLLWSLICRKYVPCCTNFNQSDKLIKRITGLLRFLFRGTIWTSSFEWSPGNDHSLDQKGARARHAIKRTCDATCVDFGRVQIRTQVLPPNARLLTQVDRKSCDQLVFAWNLRSTGFTRSTLTASADNSQELEKLKPRFASSCEYRISSIGLFKTNRLYTVSLSVFSNDVWRLCLDLVQRAAPLQSKPF